MPKIGYVQNEPINGNLEANFDRVEKLLAGVKADFLVLPELFATGYIFENPQEVKKYAEDFTGKTTTFLYKMAKKTGATIQGGFVELGEGKAYNSVTVVSPHGLVGSYRKIHLYGKEKNWFTPGNKPFHVLTFGEDHEWILGPMICFDWVFPEAARSLALLGAEVISHSANLILPFCQNAMITRCLENQVFMITANRIGREQKAGLELSFTGKSQIVNPQGEILSTAPADEEYVDVVDVDLEIAKDKWFTKKNHLFNDRRPQYYHLK
ncbi:MAG: acyltransferase [Promethearchaeota archaeon]|nr:MAG: acyltransferase [Candidatus Lokiarchaeota archaeon]